MSQHPESGGFGKTALPHCNHGEGRFAKTSAADGFLLKDNINLPLEFLFRRGLKVEAVCNRFVVCALI